MEYTTYIVDAQTLVDNVHSIKQWVYSGVIRVHIPTSCEYYGRFIFGLSGHGHANGRWEAFVMNSLTMVKVTVLSLAATSLCYLRQGQRCTCRHSSRA